MRRAHRGPSLIDEPTTSARDAAEEARDESMYPSLMPDLISIHTGPAASIPLAAAAGFRGIDLRLNKFADEVERIGVEPLADAIAAAGLRPGYCSLTAQKINVSEAAWRTEMADLPRRARLAQELGYKRATSVVVPFHEELSTSDNMLMHIERTREACDVLSDYGISFGLEYVSPRTRWEGKPNPFVRDLRGMKELLTAVDRTNAGVMLDCFHWHCAGETIDDIRSLAADRVIAVHVNDTIAGRPDDQQAVTERELPGASGGIDIGSFLRGLEEIGYEGPITSEPTNLKWRDIEPSRSAGETASAIIRCMKDAGVWNDAGRDAARADIGEREA